MFKTLKNLFAKKKTATADRYTRKESERFRQIVKLSDAGYVEFERHIMQVVESIEKSFGGKLPPFEMEAEVLIYVDCENPVKVFACLFDVNPQRIGLMNAYELTQEQAVEALQHRDELQARAQAEAKQQPHNN